MLDDELRPRSPAAAVAADVFAEMSGGEAVSAIAECVDDVLVRLDATFPF